MDQEGITFKWKDYRNKGRTRQKRMTLAADEFIRRFLLHVLPSGFHRIRHYGLIANTGRKENLARVRELLLSKETAKPTDVASNEADPASISECPATYICPDCGAPMIIIETFARGQMPRAPPMSVGGSS